MLILKLTVVPLFIALVTLAGRRWGTAIAGLLGGFPVVAGPIVVFIALEQGARFGALAATSAIAGVAGLLAFGVVYSWASIRWSWLVALACGIGGWFVTAAGLAALPPTLEVVLIVAGAALVLTPRVLPSNEVTPLASGSLADLPYRMISGALITLVVTGAAATLGEVWSGLLAAFPIIVSVLSVFTHRAQGPSHVAHLYRGMVKGLYSFGAFFLVLAVTWPRIELWSACGMAVSAAIAVQVVVQGLVPPSKALKATR